MKKLLIVLAMMLIIPAFADTMPFYISSIPKNAIGMFQAGEKITIFSEPEANSEIKKSFDFSYNPETMPDEVFGFLLNDKKLGFLYVTDIGDDGWVEVIYNKRTGARGWVLTEDKLQFMPWINFYNMYGRKYGLRLFKDAPEECNILKAQSDDTAQNLNKLMYIKKIKVTAIRGNWALVSVYDIDKTPKIGYLKWRNIDGTIYAFPNIK